MNLIHLLNEYKVAFWGGLKVTIQMCIISWAVGIFLGIILAVVAFRAGLLGSRVINSMAFITSSIPFIVILYWFHYPFQILIGFNIEPFYTAIILLSTINLIGVSKIVLDSIYNFPNEYLLAGKVCGLSNMQILKKIQLPLIIRIITPSILTLQVNILHMTLFASLISVEELFRVCQRINSQVYKPVEVYTLLALFFVIVCIPLNVLAYFMKNRIKLIAK